MQSLRKICLYAFTVMAVKAGLGIEKIFRASSDVRRVGMDRLLGNVGMTILA